LHEQLLQQKPEEAHVEETTTSATVANYIVVEDRNTNTTTSSSVVVDYQQEDDNSSSSIDLLPEAKRQRRTIIEDDSSPPDSSNNILQAAALNAVDDDAAAPAPSSSPSSVNQQHNDFAEPKFDHNLTSGDMDEKAELELKEDKDPTMVADLVPVDFDTSLVYNQSRIEAMIELHTFRSGGGNHQRRLFGPVYTVRKYKPLTDVEMVYAVIIWMDAAVKDKVEVEITSYEDYFQLLDQT